MKSMITAAGSMKMMLLRLKCVWIILMNLKSLMEGIYMVKKNLTKSLFSILLIMHLDSPQELTFMALRIN